MLTLFCDLIDLYRDIGSAHVADMVKDKTVEEMREMFNIVNDLTAEEEVRMCLDLFPALDL